jgi:nucleoside-diphosphate-sugar epimerase
LSNRSSPHLLTVEIQRVKNHGGPRCRDAQGHATHPLDTDPPFGETSGVSEAADRDPTEPQYTLPQVANIQGDDVLTGEKILVTGVSGLLGVPIATYLAQHNEVWGVARFAERADPAAMNSEPSARSAIDALGITTRPVDLAAPDLSELPDDFTYVVHMAHTRLGADFNRAVQVNAVGAGHILAHCRKAKAALVVSSAAVYSPPADVFHPLGENDDMGKAVTPWAPSSPASKVSLEAVARFCAEAFSLPTTITRLNTVYGAMGGLPILNMDAVVAGEKVVTFADPYPHSPIHIDDMCRQLEPLLDAAASAATLVNWAGDDVVTLQDWCAQAAELAGTKAEIEVMSIPGTLSGNVADVTKRRSITGPCSIDFASGFAELYRARHGN